MRPLSPRLQAVAQRVVLGQPVADIGADHGALACALVADGHVPSAVAVDVAHAPVQRARAAVSRARLEDRIEVRHGDGLTPVRPGEVGTVVICGMGGQTMCRILNEGQAQLDTVSRVVLSPHTAAEEVRRFMARAGWADVDGCWIHDRGQHYPVAAWERGTADWSEADFRWGRMARTDPALGLAAYLLAEQARLKRAYASALEGRPSEDVAVRALGTGLEDVTTELKRLRGLGGHEPA